MRKVFFVFGILLLVTASDCKSPYEKALLKCQKRCYPNIATSVDYNYNNNRYDKCVCAVHYREEEVADDQE
jgi:hypothetical protein